MRPAIIAQTLFGAGLILSLAACGQSNQIAQNRSSKAVDFAGSLTNGTQANPPQSVNVSPGIGSTRPEHVLLRKFPYPYKAMLAISSDADHQTLRKFNQIHRYLNTTSPTAMGTGLGLDISDSFFMFNGSNLRGPIDYNGVPIGGELSWFKGTSRQSYAASVIQRYIHAGWIDSLHSYGDFSMVNQHHTRFNRALAQEAIRVLTKHGDKLLVWTDHGNKSNVDNFGAYGIRAFFNYQKGANPSSPYYHTNLLTAYGVKFAWSDQSNDAFGHDNMVYPLRLPDGRRVWGFSRYTNARVGYRGITDWLWTVDDLAKQLTYPNLAKIEWQRQYAIVATHLSSDNSRSALPRSGVDALQTLAHEYHKGHILVARTSRLLNYNVSQQYLKYHTSSANGTVQIHIDAIQDPIFGTHLPTLDEVRGITFYTNNPNNVTILIGNHPVPTAEIQRNSTDGVKASIGIRWFPVDHKDYAVQAPGVV